MSTCQWTILQHFYTFQPLGNPPTCIAGLYVKGKTSIASKCSLQICKTTTTCDNCFTIEGESELSRSRSIGSLGLLSQPKRSTFYLNQTLLSAPSHKPTHLNVETQLSMKGRLAQELHLLPSIVQVAYNFGANQRWICWHPHVPVIVSMITALVSILSTILVHIR